MNKKILIGSLVVVAILVLVSFTGVVGYQTTKSSTIARASPLFAVRSSRAIDVESKDIDCDYIGKGRESVIRFPIRDSKAALIHKVIDRISRMDKKEYDRFIVLVINRLKNDNSFQKENIDDVVQVIHHLRAIRSEIQFVSDVKSEGWTGYTFCTTQGQWEPGCFFWLAISLVLGILYGWLSLILTIIWDCF